MQGIKNWSESLGTGGMDQFDLVSVLVEGWYCVYVYI